MSITVHHLNHSRSLRILWMMEELGLAYELRTWQRDSDFRAPHEARAVHPLGLFPMVEVDGQVLAESGAVLEFFAQREGKLRPSTPQGTVQYCFFMHYAEASAMPPLLVQLVVDRIRSAPMPLLARPVAKQIADRVERAYCDPAIDLHFGFIDEALGQRPFFAGDELTMADIQMYYPVEAGVARGRQQRAHLEAWLSRVRERPAFQRAQAKGGPALPPSGGASRR